jgi:fluoride ion exporter CrcB/FEX
MIDCRDPGAITRTFVETYVLSFLPAPLAVALYNVVQLFLAGMCVDVANVSSSNHIILYHVSRQS